MPILPEEADILGYNVMLAASLMTAESDALLRAAVRITTRQYIALRRLRARPELGSAELARLLFITPQSTGTLLEGLERLGYIVRSGKGQSGQKSATRLTASGAAALDRGDALIATLEEAHRVRMPPGDAARLSALLKMLLDTLLA